MKKFYILFFVLIFTSFISCKKNDHISSIFPIDSLDDNAMIANVNSTIITKAEIVKEIDNLLYQYKDKVPQDELMKMKQEIGKQALLNLINRELLLQEAKRADIKPEKALVDEYFTNIFGKFQNEEQFKSILAGMGLTEEQLMEEIETNVKIKLFLDNELPAANDSSDEDIEAFYNNNPEHFKSPEQIRVSHILITSNQNDDQKVKDEKFNKLNQIREEILKGADFAQLARENSECPSKANGGDLGFFERGKMVKSFEDAAFQLKEDEVSNIVETQYGYHIIKLTGRKSENLYPLEDVRERIKMFLNHQKRDLAVKDYLEELKKSSNIIYAEGFKI